MRGTVEENICEMLDMIEGLQAQINKQQETINVYGEILQRYEEKIYYLEHGETGKEL